MIILSTGFNGLSQGCTDLAHWQRKDSSLQLQTDCNNSLQTTCARRRHIDTFHTVFVSTWNYRLPKILCFANYKVLIPKIFVNFAPPLDPHGLCSQISALPNLSLFPRDAIPWNPTLKPLASPLVNKKSELRIICTKIISYKEQRRSMTRNTMFSVGCL